MNWGHKPVVENDLVALRGREVAHGLVDIHAFRAKETNPVVAGIDGDGIIAWIDHFAAEHNAASLIGFNLVHLAQFDALQVARPNAAVGIVGGKLAILRRNFQSVATQGFFQFAQSNVQIR